MADAAARARAGARAEHPGPAPDRAAGAARTALAQLSEEQRAELQKRLADIDVKFPPPPRATVKDFVDHIDYAVKKIGIDHVGISSDFDGGGGIDGWNGADETFNVTLELVRRGYTEAQIAKIWSGNLLRVMDEVQKVAESLQRNPVALELRAGAGFQNRRWHPASAGPRRVLKPLPGALVPRTRRAITPGARAPPPTGTPRTPAGR